MRLRVVVKDGEATKEAWAEVAHGEAPREGVALGALAGVLAGLVAEARRKLALPDTAEIVSVAVIGA